MGFSLAGGGEASGAPPEAGCADGPIVIDSDVDTDVDSGAPGDAPRGGFAVGTTGPSPACPRPSRFAGRVWPGWKSTAARGPVRSTASRDSRAGMVRVFHVYKGPRGPSVEVGSSPPLRPASTS